MVIIETSVFTKQVQTLLTDKEYHQLQVELVRRPEVGALFQVVAAYAKYDGQCQDVENGAALVLFTIGRSSKISY